MQKEKVRCVRRPLDRTDPKPAGCHVCDPVEHDYRLKRDENGNCLYVEVPGADRNVRDYVGSFATGCSLKAILDRCALLPTHEKIKYVNQTEDSQALDLSNFPKDGTEAQIMIAKLKRDHPELVEKINGGMSFNDAVKAVFGEKAQDGNLDRVSPSVEIVQNKEDNTNG